MGMPHDRKDVQIITDRQQAITQAIALADNDDVVLITGKGHEQSMNMGKGEKSWSDYEAVTKALDAKKGEKHA